MIDRASFNFVPDDITGLFRRLNGFAMYDILDTFDALLREKNFYPNSGQYRAELGAAGIFVQRMEVAMSAVMGKNGKQMSYDQFTTAFAYILAQLPEDQRINIETYFTSGPAVGGGLPASKLVKQYLAWASSAVFRTRALLDRGALNRASDFADGSLIATIKARNAQDGRDFWTVDEVAEIAINARGGNCHEFSATTFTVLKKMGARPLYWLSLMVGDHSFVEIGEHPVLDDADLKRWGNSVVVCDPWDRAFYVASEIPRRLPGMRGGRFKACANKAIRY